MSDAPQGPGWEPRDPTEPPPDPQDRLPDGKRPRRTGRRRLFPSWRTLLGTLLLLTVLLAGAFIAGYTLVDIPPANATATAQSNVYLYRDGSQIARDGEINRENVRLARIPTNVRHAVLAAEDRDFYSERAVDPQAMIRAAWNTLTGKGKQSGSTITQQYVKNYYLGQEQTITRKVKEFFIAIKLNREKSKDDIFEGYLNTSYFGRNAYGIQAAARAYYSKDVEDLDTAQGAYLASLLKAPSAYDVATHPENRTKALARWNYVLDGMVTEAWLTSGDRARTGFPTPHEARPATGLSGQRGYIVQAVEDYLTSQGIIDEKTLAGGGYRITTTLEKAKQDAFVRAVDDHVMNKLDQGNETDRYVRVGGAAIAPGSGKVLALYGGVDYTRQYVNNATRRDYQVGSTFKPFVLAAALENGSTTQDGRRITPNTVYDGANKRPVEGWHGGVYDPANEDDVDYGPITVRTATDRSVNAVYAQMAVDVGPARVKRTAVSLGLPASTPDLNSYPSIALGTATASVLDMTEAYATLANHGRHGTYTLVEKVSKDGQDLELPRSEPKQVISREAADTTTSVLRGVVETGTGTAALSAGRPAAGKTGTAEDDKAAWFAGYTPDLAAVVAVMGQDSNTGAQKPLYGALGQPRINGGGEPARIWGQFTRDALEGSEPRHFELELAEGAEPPAVPDEPLDPQAPGRPSPPQEPRPGDPGGATEGGTTEGGAVEGGAATGGQAQGGQTQGGQTQAGTTQGPATGGTTQGPAAGGTAQGAATGGTADAGATTGGPPTGGPATGSGGADDDMSFADGGAGTPPGTRPAGR
ncbi:transglycosylase domain-containing protein [Streptomyces purpureus]|uniref:transglycosylase domain-containing protein n=1 Tax=Streptomyces purpureus TaxID=1951 RepID=UPI00379E4E7A